MPIYMLDNVSPQFADRSRTYLAPSADLIGSIKFGLDTSVWFGAVIRADREIVEIGDETNVQDCAIIHADPGAPVWIGAGCTIGHRAIVHSASVGRNSLIGMGATLLNGAKIGEDSIVGANALVAENKSFPDRSLLVGVPARAVRELCPEEIEQLRLSAAAYVENGRRFASGIKLTKPGQL